MRRKIIIGTLLLAVTAAVLFLARRPLLRAAGHVLVAQDALRHVDVIIVPAWAGDAGAVEASDLVRQGFATTVAVVPEQADPADQVLVAKGIMQAGGDSWPTRLIRSLGVPHVVEIPWSASGTQSEGLLVATWCATHGVKSIIVVSTPDHSRRVRRVFRRSTRGQVEVIVTSTRYTRFDPDRWWESRGGVRTEIVELQKLALEILSHPVG